LNDVQRPSPVFRRNARRRNEDVSSKCLARRLDLFHVSCGDEPCDAFRQIEHAAMSSTNLPLLSV
jgi:hypothetical protein